MVFISNAAVMLLGRPQQKCNSRAHRAYAHAEYMLVAVLFICCTHRPQTSYALHDARGAHTHINLFSIRLRRRVRVLITEHKSLELRCV